MTYQPLDRSAGRGAGKLGQMTGGSDEDNRAEALKLLKMIGSVGWDEEDSPLDQWQRRFLASEFERLKGMGIEGFTISGREVFKLRDTWNALIDAGLT